MPMGCTGRAREPVATGCNFLSLIVNGRDAAEALLVEQLVDVILDLGLHFFASPASALPCQGDHDGDPR
jgi:hypothetical protein